MNKMLFLLTFTCYATFAENLTIVPNTTTRIAVSNSELNVITVTNDRIIEASATPGKLADKKATDSGALIFTTRQTSPFSLYIETEKGFGFTLNALPGKKSSGANLRIMNAEAKAQATQWENSSDSYSELITRTLTAVINNTIPAGFVQNGRINVNWPAATLNHFRFHQAKSFQGKQIRILTITVTNKTQQTIQLNERLFCLPQTIAIAFEPNVKSLKPQQQVMMFMLLKENPL